MSGKFVPMRVQAHMAAGVGQAAPWGIALDGLLASQLWERQKAEARAAGREYTRALENDAPPDLDLPLARCEPEDGPWHWAATCAHPDRVADRPDVHTWTGQVDERELEQVAPSLPKVISGRQGRYRARRMPLLVTACGTLTWHAVGDPDAVADLLSDERSIGKKRTSGEGHVLRWDVEPAPDLDVLTAAHLHPDGTLGRPTPDHCRRQIVGAPDTSVGRAGIRPPYMHPARQHELHLPALLS
ncbi:hypothetical protein ACFQ80_06010 [Isoptericola sp. NPDC056578]|uniref:hypothetical protein n=1 Tax=Isoptericola sp. NPDC056578 TaxID=3345870 RepID=UPI003693F410